MVLKTKEQAKANLEASIAYIPERYKAGVAAADWFGPASSEQAEKNYATAVSVAITNKRRQKGIKRVSNEEWKTAAMDRGSVNIGPAMTATIDKWAARWGPMYDKVQSVVHGLPPKTTDFMANIN
ncbi:unnamed protein product, partial [marine sediment metagenome]